MKRRDFIRYSVSASALFAGNLMGLPVRNESGKILILLELKGGNDGLNTLIPAGKMYDTYRGLRPTLAMKKSEILKLDGNWGFHPELKSLLPLWRERNLAVVHGVGYPQPNRSHFRSIAIYNTASMDPHVTAGWIESVLSLSAKKTNIPFADAVTMGSRDPGPLAGSKIRRIEINSPDLFVKRSRKLHYISSKISHPMLAYIVKANNDIVLSAKILEKKTSAAGIPKFVFPKSRLGESLKNIAMLICSGISTPVYKSALDGFDTHINQKERHARLLREFGEAIAAFEKSMKKAGRWKDITIMTYSEFGRRAAENGGKGTDHGTASVQFVIGGSVNGGMYGSAPSLSKLDNNGDLIYTTDFRTLYKSVALHSLGIIPNHLQKFKVLKLFS